MHKRVIVGTMLSWLVASATPVLAQSQPFRGLFGAPAVTAEPPRSLDFTTSLFGVYDSNPPRLLASSPSGAGRDQAFHYTDLRTGLWYTRRGKLVTFSASEGSAAQYYPQVEKALRWSQTGAVGIVARTARSAMRVEQQLGYSPFYHFRAVPVSSGSAPALADVAPEDSAFAVSGHESYRYGTGLGWTYRPTERSALGLEYRREDIKFVQAADRDWRTQDAGIRLDRSLARNVTLGAGYSYYRREFEGDRLPVIRQNIDLGVNYSNTLQSPRTTFSFSTGTAIISMPRTVDSVATQSNFFRVIGHAVLDHRLNRTWRLNASYDRGLQYVVGVSDVFFADRVMAGIGGYFGRRVDLRAATDYSTGGLRLSTRQRGYNSQASTARLRVAVSRHLAAQVEYLYYRFLFPDTVTLPTGTPSRDTRHSVRVGLTTWFPLLP